MSRGLQFHELGLLTHEDYRATYLSDIHDLSPSELREVVMKWRDGSFTPHGFAETISAVDVPHVHALPLPVHRHPSEETRLVKSCGEERHGLFDVGVTRHGRCSRQFIMGNPEIPDPVFRQAVSAIDAGDVNGLERLLTTHPGLVRERLDYGEGYFRRPYLLWFVAENPIRNEKLPGNILQVTRTILQAVQRERVNREQIDYALALVCSGRVARECGVQRELIDVLIDAGADPDGALVPALAHREVAAAERLLERGAKLTLLAAVCTGRKEDVTRLERTASADERQAALAGAALFGHADALALLIDLGVDLNAYSPPGFHPHATPLHHAVDSGSLAAVKVLAEAGAELGARDRVYQGTPLDWAEHLQRIEIAAYLRGRRKI